MPLQHMIHPGFQATEVLKRFNAVLRYTDIRFDILVNVSTVLYISKDII